MHSKGHTVLIDQEQQTAQEAPLMQLTEFPIAQAVHYMSPGKFLAIPQELWTDTLSKTEATNFISWLTNLALSQVTDRIAIFLDKEPQDFNSTDEHNVVIQSLTNALIEQSRCAIIPPFAFPHSRGWRARLAIIRYLTAILVESDRDLNLQQGQYRSMLCEYDGVNFHVREP